MYIGNPIAPGAKPPGAPVTDVPVSSSLPKRRPDGTAASYGPAVPMVYGTARVNATVVFLQDLAAKETVYTVEDNATTWKEAKDGRVATAVLAACEAPATAILRIWRDREWVDVADAYVLCAKGSNYSIVTSATPTAWSFLSGKTLANGGGMAWRGTVQLRAEKLALNEGGIPSISFEVQGNLHNAPNGYDAHPADVLIDLLTNTTLGLRMSSSDIVVDVGPDGLSASSYRTYCTAMGFYVSRAITDQQDAAALVEELLAATNSTAIWSEGTLKICPLGDVAVGSYSPPTTAAVLDEDELLFEEGADPVTVTRTAMEDVYNAWPVSISSRESDYNAITYEAVDGAHADRFGLRRAGTLSNDWISTPTHARTLSQILAQQSIWLRNTYTFRLGPRWALLEPMDLVSLTEPALGLSGTTCRISSITEAEDGSLTVEAVEWPIGAAHAVDLTPQTADGISTTATVTVRPELTAVEALDAARQVAFKDGFEVFSPGAWTFHQGSAANITRQSGGVYGDGVIRAQGYAWFASKTNVAFDPSRTYRLRVRYRQTVDPTNGQKDFLAGLEGVAADGTTLVNTAGANSYTPQHYGPGVVQTVAAGWGEYTHYWKGTAGTGTNGSTNPRTPGQLHSGVRYVRPLIICNHNGGDGTQEVDFIELTTVPGTADLDQQIGTDLIANEAVGNAQLDAALWFRESNIVMGEITCNGNGTFSVAGGAYGIASADLYNTGGGFNVVRIVFSAALPTGYYSVAVIPKVSGGTNPTEDFRPSVYSAAMGACYIAWKAYNSTARFDPASLTGNFMFLAVHRPT